MDITYLSKETLFLYFRVIHNDNFRIEEHNQRTEGPESRTDGETLIFWD